MFALSGRGAKSIRSLGQDYTDAFLPISHPRSEFTSGLRAGEAGRLESTSFGSRQ